MAVPEAAWSWAAITRRRTTVGQSRNARQTLQNGQSRPATGSAHTHHDLASSPRIPRSLHPWEGRRRGPAGGLGRKGPRRRKNVARARTKARPAIASPVWQPGEPLPLSHVSWISRHANFLSFTGEPPNDVQTLLSKQDSFIMFDFSLWHSSISSARTHSRWSQMAKTQKKTDFFESRKKGEKRRGRKRKKMRRARKQGARERRRRRSRAPAPTAAALPRPFPRLGRPRARPSFPESWRRASAPSTRGGSRGAGRAIFWLVLPRRRSALVTGQVWPGRGRGEAQVPRRQRLKRQKFYLFDWESRTFAEELGLHFIFALAAGHRDARTGGARGVGP